MEWGHAALRTIEEGALLTECSTKMHGMEMIYRGRFLGLRWFQGLAFDYRLSYMMTSSFWHLF